MRKIRKQSFEELVLENKKQLLKDQDAMDKIEAKIERRMLGKAE
ncbi:FbpB family small basic protein [Cytobacillus sp. S13-E01]|nr:FbpB family small basic protein [Cytobacillus sp. S13-E01]MDF0727999.1 FbpB family small basic protein [Cytobacillus sp. S13-E01]